MNEALNFILDQIHLPVKASDVITVEKGKIKLGEEVLTASDLKQLKAEIKALETSRIWSVMTNTIRRMAEDKIIRKSANYEEVVAGKMMIVNLDTIESIARIIKEQK